MYFCINALKHSKTMSLKYFFVVVFFYFSIVLITCDEKTFTNENVKHNFTSITDAIANVEQFILKIKNASNTPSLAFGLAHKRKTIFKKAWGYSDLENKVLATVNTGYRLARYILY